MLFFMGMSGVGWEGKHAKLDVVLWLHEFPRVEITTGRGSLKIKAGRARELLAWETNH